MTCCFEERPLIWHNFLYDLRMNSANNGYIDCYMLKILPEQQSSISISSFQTNLVLHKLSYIVAGAELIC